MKEVGKTLLAFILIFVFGVLAGKFFANSTETKETLKIEAKVETKSDIKTEEASKVKKYTEKVTKPDGTVTEKTFYEKDSTSTTNAKVDKTEINKTDKETEIKVNPSPVRIQIMVGGDFQAFPSLQNLTPVIGLNISRRLIGPINMGVWGNNKKQAGIGLGIDL